jgi:hypothetical protein
MVYLQETRKAGKLVFAALPELLFARGHEEHPQNHKISSPEGSLP